MSILTAIGMAISTLVLALTGGGSAPVPSPTPRPPDKGGVKEWVKKHLQALERALANLAGKAAAALPGIIGSIVSWLLGALGKTATWLAVNLWALVISVGALLLVAARDWQSATRPTPTPAAMRAVFLLRGLSRPRGQTRVVLDPDQHDPQGQLRVCHSVAPCDQSRLVLRSCRSVQIR